MCNFSCSGLLITIDQHSPANIIAKDLIGMYNLYYIIVEYSLQKIELKISGGGFTLSIPMNLDLHVRCLEQVPKKLSQMVR